MNKKKIKPIATIFFLIIFFPFYTYASPLIMRIALQTPEKNILTQNIMYFKERVELKSNGSIKVDIYHSGELSSDKDMPNAVGSGLFEGGVVSLNRFSKNIPLVDIFFQPFLLNTEEKIEYVVSKGSLIRTAIESSIEKTGSTVISLQPYGSVVFISNNYPIRTPDFLANKNIRVFSQTLADLALVSGGQPFVVSNSSQYFSYKNINTDVGMTLVTSINSRKLWEVMNTITITNHALVEFVVIVNSDWLKSLSYRHRKILLESAAESEHHARGMIAKIESDAYAEAEKNGMELFFVAQDDIEYWREKSQPIYKKYMENTGPLGEEMFGKVTNF